MGNLFFQDRCQLANLAIVQGFRITNAQFSQKVVLIWSDERSYDG